MLLYHIIAVLLTGFSHLLLYLYLIRYKGMSYPLVITLSVIFVVLLGVLVSVTGYTEVNTLLLLFFLLGIGFLQKRLTFFQKLYFALFSAVIITFGKLVLIELGTQMFILSPFNIYIWTGGLIHLIATMIILFIIVLSRNKIQQFAQSIPEIPLYYVSYVLLGIAVVIGIILSTPTSDWLATIHIQFAQVGYIAGMVLFLVLMMLVLISFHITKQRLLEEQQMRLDNELLDYVRKLEVLHDELASFRHDYINLLLTLDEGVRTKNLDLIEQVYYDVIAPTSTMMNDHELEIVKLSNIAIPEIKSVLSVKLLEANQHNVKVTVDIPHRIEEVAMPLVSFIRLISILVDNAIEEAVRSKDKVLDVAFFEMDRDQYFIVRNSCSKDQVDLLSIFEKGYSNKAQHRGYGLFSLKRLMSSMPNVTMETTFQSPYFTQTVLVKKI